MHIVHTTQVFYMSCINRPDQIISLFVFICQHQSEHFMAHDLNHEIDFKKYVCEETSKRGIVLASQIIRVLIFWKIQDAFIIKAIKVIY